MSYINDRPLIEIDKFDRCRDHNGGQLYKIEIMKPPVMPYIYKNIKADDNHRIEYMLEHCRNTQMSYIFCVS